MMVSGYADRDDCVKAMKLGAVDVWFKPLRLKDLVERIAALLHGRTPSPQVAAERIDKWLAEHATTKGLRMAHLCVALLISESYVAKLMREHLRTSFRRRVRFCRVAKAKELLKEPDARINIVAQECGFGDYRRLDEAFRVLEGMSPRQYVQKSAESRSK